MNLSCGRSYGSIPSTKRGITLYSTIMNPSQSRQPRNPSNLTLSQSERYARRYFFHLFRAWRGHFCCHFHRDFRTFYLEHVQGTFKSLSDPPESLEDPKRGRKKSRKWRLLCADKKREADNECFKAKRAKNMQPIWQPRTYRHRFLVNCKEVFSDFGWFAQGLWWLQSGVCECE